MNARQTDASTTIPSPRINVLRSELPPARAVALDRELAYAPGSIVSRTLARTRGGSLTLFAFDSGQELSEHTAPFDAFVQVLDGAVELTIVLQDRPRTRKLA